MTALLTLMEQALTARVRRLQAVEARLRKRVLLGRLRLGRRALRHIESERRRFARELHTGVGQLLAAIRIQIEIARGECAQAPLPAAQALDRIDRLAAEALDQVRTLSGACYPPDWQSLPLDTALYQLWERSGVAQRFAGGVRVGPPAGDLDPDIKTLLYRAAQEGLANVIRHSGASRVDLALDHSAGCLRLTVADDGVGFDAARVFEQRTNPPPGIGLRSIRDHAAALGGMLRVESGAAGTRLEVSVPLPG